MLFELTGRRKRFVQVIFTFLALIFTVSFVGLGIGSDASGGIFDAIGLGGGGGSGDSALDSDIEDAEKKLEADPENQAALLTIAKSQYLAGQAALEIDDQGRQTLTDDAAVRFDEALSAWEQFLLVTEGKSANFDNRDEVGTTATLILNAYGADDLTQQTLDGGLQTAQIVAAELPNVNSFLQLAAYAYAAGNTKVAEQAGEDALGEVDQTERSTLEDQLKQAEEQGKLIQQQLKAQAPTEDDFQNPLGGLGGAGGGALPDGGAGGQGSGG